MGNLKTEQRNHTHPLNNKGILFVLDENKEGNNHTIMRVLVGPGFTSITVDMEGGAGIGGE